MFEQPGQRTTEANRSDSPIAGDASYYEGQDLHALADIPAYYGWILNYFRPHLRGKVIEIGAGLGNISSHYVDSAQDVLLVEPAENLHAHLKQRFESKLHVRTICALMETVQADAAASPGAHGAPFDAALMVNVLEHVFDEASVLKSIRGILRPQGMLLVFVPALPWLYGRLDKKVGHERRYTRRGLSQVIEQAGFSIESIRYFDFPGILPWFFAGRVRRSQEFPEGAAKLYDRWVVPVARAVETRIKPPIGKNLLCVARATGQGNSNEDGAPNPTTA
jgi:SAM-dependent methyltransferase